MAQPYVGEIRMFAGNFVIAGWAFCDGALVSISENEVLFQLIGTTYGGDGQNTFGLPDLRGRVPVHMGSNGQSNYVIAQTGGAETVTLTQNQMPSHSHAPLASNTGGSDSPANNFWANSSTGKPYGASPGALAMNTGAIASTGGGQPHDNMIPFLCVTYIISLFGIFPSPN